MRFVLLALSFVLIPFFSLAQQSVHLSGIAVQGPDHYTFTIGEAQVTSLSDGSVPQDLHVLLRNTTVKKTDALLTRSFLANPVEASLNAFLISVGDRRILVDTGAGQFFGNGFGDKLVSSLRSVGVAPEQITDVLLTHAHDDHMGGLVHSGKLTFPNATVHMSKADLIFFMDRSNAQRAGYPMSYFDQAATALQPCLDAGKIETFDTDKMVLPGITAEVHPGHTPGSTFYTLRSHGQELVFTGDIIHVASVQAPSPEITITYDVDPAKAAAVRREALASFAAHGTLVAIPHFSFPGVGHFRQIGTGFEWVPIPYANRNPGSDASFADPHKGGNR